MFPQLVQRTPREALATTIGYPGGQAGDGERELLPPLEMGREGSCSVLGTTILLPQVLSPAPPCADLRRPPQKGEHPVPASLPRRAQLRPQTIS